MYCVGFCVVGVRSLCMATRGFVCVWGHVVAPRVRKDRSAIALPSRDALL
jgi:hypothetical protein